MSDEPDEPTVDPAPPSWFSFLFDAKTWGLVIGWSTAVWTLVAGANTAEKPWGAGLLERFRLFVVGRSDAHILTVVGLGAAVIVVYRVRSAMVSAHRAMLAAKESFAATAVGRLVLALENATPSSAYPGITVAAIVYRLGDWWNSPFKPDELLNEIASRFGLDKKGAVDITNSTLETLYTHKAITDHPFPDRVVYPVGIDGKRRQDILHTPGFEMTGAGTDALTYFCARGGTGRC